jgi:ribosomal protein S18 acetylase RimI-like enzyme
MTSHDHLVFRQGTPEDAYAVFLVFQRATTDLAQRFGDAGSAGTSDLQTAGSWGGRRALYEFLAAAADQFWVAEDNGQVVGYARSIVWDGVRELTELFVEPRLQSCGIGRTLMEHAFPQADRVAIRSVVGSADVRATALYLRAGVYPHTPVAFFFRTPEMAMTDSDLTIEPAAPDDVERLANIDHRVLGHRRDEIHRWLLVNKTGHLYLRNGSLVGYGYHGARNGPFAILNAHDFPHVLAHAEREAAQAGRRCVLEVPLVNHHAVNYLLGRGFKMDSFIVQWMMNYPFAKMDHYILSSPPFFI